MRNPFGREIIVSLLIAALAAGVVIGGPLWSSPPGAVQVALQVAPWLVAEALLLAVYLVVLTASFMRRTRRLVDGGAWVHWQFEADEWDRIRKQPLWGDTGQSKLAFIAEFFITLFILSVLLFGMSQISPQWDIFDTPLLVIAGLGISITLAVYFSGGSARKVALSSVGDLYISLSGVYLAGNYFPLDGLFLKLVEADVLPGQPATLWMVRRFQAPWLMRHGPLPREVNRELRIPVPAANATEAERLAKRLLLNQPRPWNI